MKFGFGTWASFLSRRHQVRLAVEQLVRVSQPVVDPGAVHAFVQQFHESRKGLRPVGALLLIVSCLSLGP